MKEKKFALGYMRVNNVHDDEQVNKKIKQMKEYCDVHGILLPMILSEEKSTSRNFTGQAWKEIELMLHYSEGRIHTIIVSDRDNLTRDISLLLLKESELKQKYGVTIDVLDGKSLKMDHSQGFSMN